LRRERARPRAAARANRRPWRAVAADGARRRQQRRRLRDGRMARGPPVASRRRLDRRRARCMRGRRVRSRPHGRGGRGERPRAGALAAERTVGALTFGPWRIATPICYEAIRPELVRRMVTETHPHLFVTLANDAWFGDSQEPWLHLGLAQLRAIEHRRWLVR